jgi:hypothetical protein
MHDLADIFARRISNIPQPINDTEFTFDGKKIQKTVIKTSGDLEAAVEREIVDSYGLESLFTQNDVATSTADWASVIHSSMEAAYDLDRFSVGAVEAAVRKAKDKHRVKILSTMENNFVSSLTEEQKADPDLDLSSTVGLKKFMQKRGAFLEAADDEVIQKLLEGTVGQEDYDSGWLQEEAQLSKYPKGRDDLVKLIDACSGNLHSGEIGTVVGGTAIMGKAKKVRNLDEPSARIDRQNPPPGAYNIQYQVGGGSCAGVIFDQSDPHEVVLKKLLESFDSGMQLRSPRVKPQH